MEYLNSKIEFFEVFHH